MIRFLKIILSLVLLTNLIINVKLQECGTPEDCVVSEWNQWSVCSQTCGELGTRSRSRVFFRIATCGGTCPYDIQETEACNRKCCPVDCKFSSWTKWKSCHCTEEGCEGDGERYKCIRTRQKLSNATCGGYCDEQTTQEECGYLCCLRDCILGFWTPWSACDARCEQEGLKRRSRAIIQDTACGGKPCEHREEVAKCMGGCCPIHCVIGEWGEWSSCNTTCGEGTQIRNRFIQLPECGGDPCPNKPMKEERKTCSHYINVDCTLSVWSSWSSCFLDNGFCGVGTKFRTRTVLTSPVCNGEQCGNLKERELCYGPCCKQDCIVTEWSEWGFCSSSCGQGISKNNMTDTRDTWYKPNLLYNIHYRPPKQAETPNQDEPSNQVDLLEKAWPTKQAVSSKMVVVTKRFNPSFCTCGEHGCMPHYRMEREVIWSDKVDKCAKYEDIERMERSKCSSFPQAFSPKPRDSELCGKKQKASVRLNVTSEIEDTIRDFSSWLLDAVIYESTKKPGDVVTYKYFRKPVDATTNGSVYTSQVKLRNAITHESSKELANATTQESSTELSNFTTQEPFTGAPNTTTQESFTGLASATTQESSAGPINAATQESSTVLENATTQKSSRHPANAATQESFTGPAIAASQEFSRDPANAATQESSTGPANAASQESSRDPANATTQESSTGLANATDAATHTSLVDEATDEASVSLDTDNDEFGSSFGIMRVFCDSELHTGWIFEQTD